MVPFFALSDAFYTFYMQQGIFIWYSVVKFYVDFLTPTMFKVIAVYCIAAENPSQGVVLQEVSFRSFGTSSQ